MRTIFPFLPEQASTFAENVDNLYLFLIALSVFFSVLIAGLIVVFAVRFRRRSNDEQPAAVHEPFILELAWTVIPMILVLVIFAWGAWVFVSMSRVPPNAMEIYVVGKRWMWKLQHMTGQREINELHVPLGTPIKLIMTSEDVIHSFFVPAFRMKHDVLPGRYEVAWFQATQTGRFHLFCAEYCGTKHSGMIGSVVVMEPSAFQTWLAGGTAGSPAAEGEKLFQSLACATCHRADSQGRGPRLENLFGRTIQLADGTTVKADADYVRESILTPSAKVVAGYQPIMPTFQGLVSEEGVLQLIAYIQSLQGPTGGMDAPLAPGQSPPPAKKGTGAQKP